MPLINLGVVVVGFKVLLPVVCLLREGKWQGRGGVGSCVLWSLVASPVVSEEGEGWDLTLLLNAGILKTR